MPSQFNTFGGQQRSINGNNNTANTTSSNAKAGGTANAAFNKVQVSNPAQFDGSSNDQLQAVLATTGVSATQIRYINGSLIGETDTIRKEIEIGIDNRNLGNQDGNNNITTVREQLTTGAGLRMTRDGKWISPTGAVVATPSATGLTFALSASGDLAAVNERNVPGQYYYKPGGATVTDKSLPTRTN